MLAWLSKHVPALNLGIAVAGLALLMFGALAVQAADEGPAATPSEAAATGITWQEAVKMFAAALAIATTAFATAITQCRIGSAGVGALAENPKLFGNILIFLVIPETMVILGFVIAALMLF